MMHDPRHIPVLIDEVVGALQVGEGDTLVDGTFGAGGYTRALLAAGAGRVIGFDRDPDAVREGAALVPDARLTLIEANAAATPSRSSWPSMKPSPASAPTTPRTPL